MPLLPVSLLKPLLHDSGKAVLTALSPAAGIRRPRSSAASGSGAAALIDLTADSDEDDIVVTGTNKAAGGQAAARAQGQSAPSRKRPREVATTNLSVQCHPRYREVRNSFPAAKASAHWLLLLINMHTSSCNLKCSGLTTS